MHSPQQGFVDAEPECFFGYAEKCGARVGECDLQLRGVPRARNVEPVLFECLLDCDGGILRRIYERNLGADELLNRPA